MDHYENCIGQFMPCSVVFIYTKWKLDLHFKGHRLPTVASLLADKSSCMETCRQFYWFSQVADR